MVTVILHVGSLLLCVLTNIEPVSHARKERENLRLEMEGVMNGRASLKSSTEKLRKKNQEGARPTE